MSFGPGAMMDLPTRSVVVTGLDHWDSSKAKFKRIEEPRLSSFLETVLTQTGRWPHGKPVQLRTPPIAHENGYETDPAGVSVRVFPTWFTCDGFPEDPEEVRRRRRLVRWRELDAGSGHKKYTREDKKKVDVAPIRFVGACKKGHLQDINWKWLVHRDVKCSEAMWIEEEGSSADPANIRIGCLCGRSLSLADAFKPGFLGACHGERPWLDSREEGCTEQLHFLSRSATNTYFPQTITLISLPIYEDDLSEAVRKHWSSLQSATSPDFIGILRNVPEIGASLVGFSNEAVFENVQRQRSALAQDTAQDPKIAEFELLASGKAVIGEDKPSQPLFAETLPTSGTDPLGLVESTVAVHRLQAVTCLYGFTRLEPAPTMQDEHLEDVRIAAEGAPLSERADWLPAMEQKGEGVFIKVRAEKIAAWLERKDVKTRGEQLREGALRHEVQYGVKQPFPELPYTLLHTLSHALMDEIALSCGYPISSLRERVYAIRGDSSSPDRFGILIYTASAGAQGTLGGLTESAWRISELIEAALDRLRLCSNDPVCAEHDPSIAGDERALLGAACHSCLLAPETSCEARNSFLDRALLIATIAESEAEISS